MSAPTVVMHRPPLRRIETAPKPRSIEPETASEATIALRQLGERIENERIWGHVRRTAEGCNKPSVATDEMRVFKILNDGNRTT